MGKHKKFLKSEKAKVKLKGNKLKGPQNVTKTDFKVKKIVITNQLKNVVEEQGTKKVHSVHDCLTRLRNSTSAEAISNLKDIIQYQEEDVQKNLEDIIKTIGNMALSLEKTTRNECFRLLNILCAQKTLNLKPFFSIFMTYLKCAMTHIKSGIQEDSLSMLNILIKNFPQLVVAERDDIFIPYLDLMSKTKNESSQERSITLHSSSNKIMSVKWRKTVLEQLIVLLKCLNTHKISSEVKHSKEMLINVKDKFAFNPFHLQRTNLTVSLKSSSTQNFNQTTSSSLKKYINMIMPLMFESWVELKDANATNTISNESSIVLKLIMDVITELFELIKEDEEAKKQFLSQYQDRFEKQILSNFPYIQNEKGKKTIESGGEKCIYQNLAIANLFVFFAVKNPQRFRKYRDAVFTFIEDQIGHWKAKDQEFITMIHKFIHSIIATKDFANETKKVFIELVKSCDSLHASFDIKLRLVCKIIEKIEGDMGHDKIIAQMIKIVATKENVPSHLVKTLLVLAKKDDSRLVEAIEQHAAEIVNNLPKLKASDNENLKEDIKKLLFWIKDKEVLEKIHQQAKEMNDQSLVHICEISLLKY